MTTRVITAEGKTYQITVTYGPDAKIPRGSVLVVNELLSDDDNYNSYKADTAAALNTSEEDMSYIKLLDITIMNGDEKVEVAAPVDVEITLLDREETDQEQSDEEVGTVQKDEKNTEEGKSDKLEMRVVHFGQNTEEIEAANIGETVSFSTDGFSVYAIVGTETLTTNYITAEGDTYTITVTYGKDAEIPDGATLEVSELANDNKEYTDYVEQAAKALAEGEEVPFVNAARLFNISIMADGKKVEPKAPVEVKIEYANAENLNETSEVGAVHFKESTFKTEAEKLDVEVQGEGQMEGVTFTTDSFSIYAVVIIDKEAGTFVVEDDDYKVTITYTKEANIPIGTELTVKEITPEEDRYWELRTQTIEKINEGVEWEDTEMTPDPRKGVSDAAFFDISLINNGEEIEPDVPLQVKIEYKENGMLVPADEDTNIIHFAKDGTEIIDDVDVQYSETENEDEKYAVSYEYEQESFSVVGSYSTGEYIEINESNIINPSAGILSAPILKAAGDSSITASKTVTDEDGDGVYDLTLSVTGQSESSTSTTVNKSNVVLVIDTSGSMGTNYVYSKDTGTSGTHYGIVNNNYVELTYSGGQWYYNSYGWHTYTGDRYIRQTRMEATKDAAVELVDALLGNNKNETTEDGVSLSDVVEISLITFAGCSNNNQRGYLRTYNNYHYSGTKDGTDGTSLKSTINNLSAVGGTNWEQALKAALASANTYSNQTGESTSIIFLTDGMPTRYSSSDSGTGQEERDNVHNSWNGAADDARALITNGYTLYNIFAFGTDTVRFNNDNNNTDADYLRSLTNYAYTGSGNYNNKTLTDTTKQYFFNASDTSALQDAFNAIINKINGNVGYGGVMVDDGVTTGVTSTSVTVGGNVNTKMFRYSIKNGSTTLATVSIDGNNATFTINGTEYPATGETVTTVINGTTHTNTVFSVTVGDKTYKMSPASFDNNGKIQWDLAGIGIIENGYTYELSFDVWPNQYAYDLVADLNNKVKTLDQIKAELIEEKGQEAGTALYNQIVAALEGPDANGQYSVRTNYEQYVDYYTVETETNEQTGETTTTYTAQPRKELGPKDPVALTSKPLPMKKIWNSDLSPDQIGNLLYNDYPTNSDPTKYQVTLHVWKADTKAELDNLISQYSGDPTTASEHDYIEKTLGWNDTLNGYVWDDTLSIAPGTMISLTTAQNMGITIDNSKIVTYNGTQYYVVESGHYYYVTEDNIDWHFELETVLYHPMLVDGKLKNVTFTTDAQGNITGVEDIVDLTQVSAANSKTAELDITKIIVDNTGKMTDAQKDAETFTFKVTLTVPKDADMSHTNAYEYAPYFDGAGSTVPKVYGYQTDESADVVGLSSDVGRFNGVYAWWTTSYPGGGATLDEMFTEANGVTVNSDGSRTNTIYITLRRDEIIRFTNLPSGTKYVIEEIYNNLYTAHPSRDANAKLTDAPDSNIEANGYTVSIATKNGNPTVSGRVVTGTIDELNKRYYNQFTNTLNDTAVVDLDVTKHLQGYEWNGDRYYVKLAAEEETTPLPRITTRYLSAASGSDDVTFNFGSVHLKPGTYTYTITETADDFTEVYSGKVVNGVTYDAVKTIIVTVASDLSVSIAEGSSDGVTYDSDTNTVKTKVTNKVLPLSIYKFGGTDINNKLEGVEFKLYSDAALTTQVTQDARGNAIGTDGLITTGSEGTATIGVLSTGTYYLVETGLGDNGGYNKLTDAVEITIGDTIHYKQTAYSASERYSSASREADLVKSNGGMYINYAEDGTTIAGYTFTINNSTGVELPNTGGPGTLPYTLGGIALIMASALMYGFRMRRRERRLN